MSKKRILSTSDFVEEFQKKCMETVYAEANDEITRLKSNNKSLRTEIKNLNQKLKAIETEYSMLQQTLDLTKLEYAQKLSNSDLMLSLFDAIKVNCQKDEDIYKLFSLLFTKDYNESQDCPLWIGILTQYYSHKTEAIEILRILNVKLPVNVESFRLPFDWNKEELDIFMKTMHKHVNCNGCTYSENLKFWASTSLDTVAEQCSTRFYDEIPWQFVLRNPSLKNPEYLTMIGKNLEGSSSNWCKFVKLDEYQELTDEELLLIINNINPLLLKKRSPVTDFCLKHINLITRKELLDVLYQIYTDTWEFDGKFKILEMPYEYIWAWCKEHCSTVTLNLLKSDNFKQSKLTRAQKKELCKEYWEWYCE